MHCGHTHSFQWPKVKLPKRLKSIVLRGINRGSTLIAIKGLLAKHRSEKMLRLFELNSAQSNTELLPQHRGAPYGNNYQVISNYNVLGWLRSSSVWTKPGCVCVTAIQNTHQDWKSTFKFFLIYKSHWVTLYTLGGWEPSDTQPMHKRPRSTPGSWKGSDSERREGPLLESHCQPE